MKELKYHFFTTNEIKPTGWIKKQLLLEANGLAGNLDKVWPDVKDSAWIGGTCEGWERVPYWLDGFIPLAYLLEDEDMISRAKRYLDAIINSQAEDGWICPCKEEERANYDTWAVLLITKVLCLYADCSGDERITEVVGKCLKNFDEHLNKHTLRDWGAARWYEGLIAVSWLYEKTKEDWLLALAVKLNIQGFDWKAMLKNDLFKSCDKGWDFYSHIVNIAMMFKSQALWSLFSEESDENFAKNAYAYFEQNFGTAVGHFTGDECLSKGSPIQGAELCSVVELMFSYEWLFAVTGKPIWLDRLELLAYNSLPASVSPDMWSHQYLQMINQVACFPMENQPFRTNNNVAHTFGLEPHFGCCTANHGQGFPKFVLSGFMKTENGIASCALCPSKVSTDIDGTKVECELITEYPFRNKLIYRISAEKPACFTFFVRIPSFVAGFSTDMPHKLSGGFMEITQKWEGTREFEVEFEMKTEIVKRPDDMIAVRRGPLFYSIPVKERWEKVEYVKNGVERKFPYCDYYIYPESKWNYALAGDKFELCENSFENPFSPENPPITITCDVAEIEWGFTDGHCDRLPKSRKLTGKPQKIALIPYGCTNLRMTEIPFVDSGKEME